MRILGVDFGDKRTGVALSDELGWTAQGLTTIFHWDKETVAEKVAETAKENKVEKIVLGLPKNMDGTVGFRGEKTKEFKEILETKVEVPVVFWDERLSTVSATRTLNETNVRGKKRKEVIDTVAATYILQGYLDSNYGK